MEGLTLNEAIIYAAIAIAAGLAIFGYCLGSGIEDGLTVLARAIKEKNGGR